MTYTILKRKAKFELCMLLTHLSGLIGWGWLATAYAVPPLPAIAVTMSVVASFVRSFEAATDYDQKLVAVQQEESTHG